MSKVDWVEMGVSVLAEAAGSSTGGAEPTAAGCAVAGAGWLGTVAVCPVLFPSIYLLSVVIYISRRLVSAGYGELL
jgi:hypothetical protein